MADDRRPKLPAEPVGLGHSFAADNVARGEPDADFIKRRPNFPISDDPRAREIDFAAAVGGDMTIAGAIGKPVFRSYRRVPLEGQDFTMPKRIGKLINLRDLRPELPSRSVDTVALKAAKEQERALLESTDFAILFPTTTILAPSPGANFSPGDTINIHARGTYRGLAGGIQRAVLIIDGNPVFHRVLDRRDQDNNQSQDWFFEYAVPLNRSPGPLEIKVRTFSMSNSARAIIADDAFNLPPQAEPFSGALGTLDGRPGDAQLSATYQKLFDDSFYLRRPGGDAAITVTIV